MGRRHTARPDFFVQRCMIVAVSAMPAEAKVMPTSALSARPMLFSLLVGIPPNGFEGGVVQYLRNAEAVDLGNVGINNMSALADFVH